MKEMLAVCGLSKGLRRYFDEVQHYRKNRQFVWSRVAALTMRLIRVVWYQSPRVGEAIEKPNNEDATCSERMKAIWESGLLVSSLVAPSAVEQGRLIVEGAMELAKHSVNAHFYLLQLSFEVSHSKNRLLRNSSCRANRPHGLLLFFHL